MRKRAYHAQHSGPYLLVGQTIDDNRIKIKKVINELINKIGPSDFIKAIANPGGKSIKIFVNDRSTANDLSGEIIENIKMIIPQSLVECVGVSYIDLDYDDREISETGMGFNRNAILHNPTKILEIRRNKKINKNSDGEPEEIRLNSVVITFEGTSLPTDIDIGNVLFKVYPFVRRPKQCRNCWRFNHIAKFCRQKEPKCAKCGETHESANECEVKCINCKSNHYASDKKCPKFLEATKKMNEKINSEKNRQELMFKKNREGKALPVLFSNKDYDNNFPPLSYSNISDNNQKLNVPMSTNLVSKSRKRSIGEADKEDCREHNTLDSNLTKSPKIDLKSQTAEKTILIRFKHPKTKEEAQTSVEVSTLENIIRTTGVLQLQQGIVLEFKNKPYLSIYDIAKLVKARLI